MPTALTDLAEEEPVNILYVGPGGTAKTTNILAAAKRGKVWVANAESGVKARALRQRGIPVENIEVFPDPAKGEVLTYEGLEAEWWEVGVRSAREARMRGCRRHRPARVLPGMR